MRKFGEFDVNAEPPEWSTCFASLYGRGNNVKMIVAGVGTHCEYQVHSENAVVYKGQDWQMAIKSFNEQIQS